MAKTAMCTNPTCPMRESCQRHAAGGAVARKEGQPYLHEQRYGGSGCDFYWPVPAHQEAVAA